MRFHPRRLPTSRMNMRIDAIVVRDRRSSTDAPAVHEDLRANSLRSVRMLVAAITVASVLLRLPSFSDSLFGDELSTYFIVSGPQSQPYRLPSSGAFRRPQSAAVLRARLVRRTVW